MFTPPYVCTDTFNVRISGFTPNCQHSQNLSIYKGVKGQFVWHTGDRHKVAKYPSSKVTLQVKRLNSHGKVTLQVKRLNSAGSHPSSKVTLQVKRLNSHGKVTLQVKSTLQV